MTKKRIHHIDGLRALAIIMIVLFHFSQNVFPGGYFGVEVFLAISGFFLLKKYLLGENVTNSFKVFFVNKLGRLYLPMIVILILTLVASCFIYHYKDLMIVSDTGFSALFGVANIYLDAFSRGYFATDAFSNPLVHLWYLGVIIQVYLLFGVLIYTTQRYIQSKTTRRIIVFLIAIVSFFIDASNVKFLGYYSVFSRLWVVVAGGFAAIMFEKSIVKNSVIQIILCLISVSFLIISLFYGKCLGCVTVVAVVIASCILICYGGAFYIGGILKNRVCLFIGKISFSIYLCHMPFIVMMKYYFDKDFFNNYEMYILCCISIIPIAFVFAYILYQLVEKRRVGWRIMIPLFVFTLFIYGGLSFTQVGTEYVNSNINKIIKQNEYPKLPIYTGYDLVYNYPDKELAVNRDVSFAEVRILDSVKKMFSSRQRVRTGLSSMGNTKQPVDFVLLGDSHGGAIASGLHHIGQEKNWHGVRLQTYVIPAWSEEYENHTKNTIYDTSRHSHELIFEWLSSHPEIHTVFIAQRWSCRYDDYKKRFYPGDCNYASRFNEDCIEYFVRLKETGKQIVILAEVPRFRLDVSKYVYKNAVLERELKPEYVTCTKNEHEQRNAHTEILFTRLKELGLCDKILYPEPCLEHNGLFQSVRGNQPLMLDDNHINPCGAALVMEYLSKEFLEILHKGRSLLTAGD